VRGRGAGGLARTPGFHGDHRLVARRGSRRRHELAGAGDGLDVQQDRARARVAPEVIEQIAEVDIRGVTE